MGTARPVVWVVMTQVRVESGWRGVSLISSDRWAVRSSLARIPHQ